MLDKTQEAISMVISMADGYSAIEDNLSPMLRTLLEKLDKGGMSYVEHAKTVNEAKACLPKYIKINEAYLECQIQLVPLYEKIGDYQKAEKLKEGIPQYRKSIQAIVDAFNELGVTMDEKNTHVNRIESEKKSSANRTR